MAGRARRWCRSPKTPTSKPWRWRRTSVFGNSSTTQSNTAKKKALSTWKTCDAVPLRPPRALPRSADTWSDVHRLRALVKVRENPPWNHLPRSLGESPLATIAKAGCSALPRAGKEPRRSTDESSRRLANGGPARSRCWHQGPDRRPYFLRDRDHGVFGEWGNARTRPGHGRPRKPAHHQALLPQQGTPHARRDRAHQAVSVR